MAALAFSRRWGQTHITRTLRNAIASGRITHAYLFRARGVAHGGKDLAKCLGTERPPSRHAEPASHARA
jgi:DNA polymerase III gamma/tau subunit